MNKFKSTRMSWRAHTPNLTYCCACVFGCIRVLDFVSVFRFFLFDECAHCIQAICMSRVKLRVWINVFRPTRQRANQFICANTNYTRQSASRPFFCIKNCIAMVKMVARCYAMHAMTILPFKLRQVVWQTKVSVFIWPTTRHRHRWVFLWVRARAHTLCGRDQARIHLYAVHIDLYL